MRLGQVLLADGAISGDQLQQALDAQLIHGGHLGTCLLELGYVDEERLGRALALTADVPCAPASAFQEIPPFVLEALPANLVQKLAAMPIGLEDNILDVAMIDPKNRQALDELRSVTGCVIRSWIAPEMRIFQAQEHYYDFPRRIRYVSLCRAMDKGRSSLESSPVPDRHRAPGRRSAAQRHASRSAATLEAVDTGAAARVAAQTISDPLAAVSHLFCDASSEDEIAEVVLSAMKDEVPRRILFRVQGGSAYVWKAMGAKFDPNVAGGVRFPILSEPVFGLLNGDDVYAGPLPFDPIHLGFYRKLGIETPKRIVLLPVHFDDQLVAMFYGDCGRTGSIDANIETYRRLLSKAALAINVVQTKQRIHAT